MKERHLFIIPGLGDPTSPAEWAVRNFPQKYSIIPHVKPFGFMTEGSFDSKLHSLIEEIKPFAEDKNIITSLLGMSAGASAVVNAWSYLSDHGLMLEGKLISVCGRLRNGKEEDARPSLEFAARKSPVFYESVEKAEEILKNLPQKQRKNMLTFQAFFDEVVPASTSIIDGTTNIRVPMIEHMLTISTVLMFYQKHIADFIKSQAARNL